MTGSPRIASLCVAVAVILLAACAESTSPSGPFSGHWEGAPPDYPALDFTLMQRDSLLTGSGAIALTSPVPYTQPLLVIGTDFRATLALTFSSENTIPAIFRGSLSANGDTLDGRLALWGAQGDTAVTFHRVP